MSRGLTSPQRRKLLVESDYEQRQLEKKAAGGGHDEQAQFLRRKLRTGEVTEERLKVAARLGYKPALQLYPYEKEQQEAWTTIIMASGLSKNELINFVSDCIEEVLLGFEKVYPDDTRPREVINAIRSGDNLKTVASFIQTLRTHVDQNFRNIYGALATAWQVVAMKERSTTSAVVAEYTSAALFDAASAGLDHSWIKNRFVQYLLR